MIDGCGIYKSWEQISQCEETSDIRSLENRLRTDSLRCVEGYDRQAWQARNLIDKIKQNNILSLLHSSQNSPSLASKGLPLIRCHKKSISIQAFDSWF